MSPIIPPTLSIPFNPKEERGLLLLGCVLLWLSIPGIAPSWINPWAGSLALLPLLGALVISAPKGPRHAFRQGFKWGFAYHALYFTWLLHLYPLRWLELSDGLSGFLAGSAWLVLCGFEGVGIGLIWCLTHHCLKRGPLGLLFGLPVLWVFGYWAFNLFPIGVPWGFLSYSLVNIDVVRLSTRTLTFFGTEALIVLLQVALFLLLLCLLSQYRQLYTESGLDEALLKDTQTASFPSYWGLTFFLVLLAGLGGLVFTGRPLLATPAWLTELSPALVQGQIPLEVEHGSMTPLDKLDYYKQRTPNPRQYSLIVWPEGIVNPANRHELERWMDRQYPARRLLLTGGTELRSGKPYNAAILFQASSSTLPNATYTVYKRSLVAFGESIPFIPASWMNPVLLVMGINYQPTFEPGSWTQFPLTFDYQGTLYSLGPFLCFEASLPALGLLYKTQKVDGLVTLSNLSWFHGHPALAQQFLTLNQFRAAETGVPLLLVVNGGPSAIISANGQILKQAPRQKSALITYP